MPGAPPPSNTAIGAQDQYPRASVQSHLDVEVSNTGARAVIAVAGELDLASSPALEAAIEQTAGAGVVIIDLRRLEFMDSTGLSVLVKAHQQAEEAGRKFALVRGPQQVQRLLTLTGVADRLQLVDDPDELTDES